MGMRHKQFALQGVQFHPESFMTQNGKQLLQNFLDGVN
jgi:anthranilate/para-aminobenzoate synthase component II